MSATLPQRTWAVAATSVREILGRFGVATPADVPLAVLRMTRDEAEAFFAAAMAADGYGGDTFAKTDLAIVEAVQISAFLTGRSSGVISERTGNEMTTKPCLSVGIHKAGHKYLSEFKETRLPPREVWCPTTEIGTWVASFNGFIGITGNTKAIGRALNSLGYSVDELLDDDPELANRGAAPNGGGNARKGGAAPAGGLTWTAFWKWAREEAGLESRAAIETLLGQQIGGMEPKAVQDAIKRARAAKN